MDPQKLVTQDDIPELLRLSREPATAAEPEATPEPPATPTDPYEAEVLARGAAAAQKRAAAERLVAAGRELLREQHPGGEDSIDALSSEEVLKELRLDEQSKTAREKAAKEADPEFQRRQLLATAVGSPYASDLQVQSWADALKMDVSELRQAQQDELGKRLEGPGGIAYSRPKVGDGDDQ
jgi:hypothetical protein